ncbi:hypothetical protein GCM10010385_37480 [Streptomyces geysiriensis]|nr:hypothetical protein GCM10010385_37480 [Streptomyces geysiriensis]
MARFRRSRGPAGRVRVRHAVGGRDMTVRGRDMDDASADVSSRAVGVTAPPSPGAHPAGG